MRSNSNNESTFERMGYIAATRCSPFLSLFSRPWSTSNLSASLDAGFILESTRAVLLLIRRANFQETGGDLGSWMRHNAVDCLRFSAATLSRLHRARLNVGIAMVYIIFPGLPGERSEIATLAQPAGVMGVLGRNPERSPRSSRPSKVEPVKSYGFVWK